MTANARHSKNNPSWTTPPEIIEVCRAVLNGIALDPFSSAIANQTVKAQKYFTPECDGFEQDWDAPTVFVNPPGLTIKRSWHKVCQEIRHRNAASLAWVGFSIEQLALLADPALKGETDIERVSRGAWHPLDFSTVILRKRISFVAEDGSTGSPSHSNYLTFMNVPSEIVNREAGHLGLVFHGVLAVP